MPVLPTADSRYIVFGREIRTAGGQVAEAGMDRLGNGEAGAPERRPWTQGPWHDDSWHGATADQAQSQGTWNQGTWQGAGFGDGVFAGDWAVATVAARNLARRVLRFLLLSA